MLAAIDPPRREQFLRTNNAKLITQLRADQILAAITAGKRKVSGIIECPVCPIRDQARVLIVRMRRNVEDPAEDIQFFERETDLRGVQ